MGTFLFALKKSLDVLNFGRQMSKSIIIKNPSIKKSSAIPRAIYGGRHTVTLLPGTGIGPELMDALKSVFKYAGIPVDFETINIENCKEGNEDVSYAVSSIRRNGVGIKANIETDSKCPTVWSRDIALRNQLDLFVNVMNCRTLPGIPAKHTNLDLVIIRQNTEGEYAMLEHESVPGIVECLKIVTRSNSERIGRFAFEYARRNGRKKITTIHKADILKLADGLFLDTVRKIAREYPDIEHTDMLIDNCCMQLVLKPHQFDIMIMTNLYGTIVSNIVCGLLKGCGIYSSKNYGEHYAVFEPGTRCKANSLVGRAQANPIVMLNAGVDLLKHLQLYKHAAILNDAINKTLCEHRIHTPDLGGMATTKEVVDSIISNISTTSF